MNKVTEINKEALVPVISARAKAIDLANTADNAIKEARLAELEFKLQVQQLYLEKGLNTNCKIELATGTVTWPEDTQAVDGVVTAEGGVASLEEDVPSPTRKIKRKYVKATQTEK